MEDKDKNISFFNALSLLTTIGISMVANVMVGLFLGRLLDKYLHTQPWMTMLFLILGCISGSRATFKMIKK